MPTPIIPILVGASVDLTLGSTIASGAFSTAALGRINTSSALLADFRFPVTGMTAPTGGALQLIIVPRNFAGGAGGTPSATLTFPVYSFSPMPAAGNTSGTFVFSLDKVAIDRDCDVWLYNNGLNVALPTGTLSYQLHTVGT